MYKTISEDKLTKVHSISKLTYPIIKNLCELTNRCDYLLDLVEEKYGLDSIIFCGTGTSGAIILSTLHSIKPVNVCLVNTGHSKHRDDIVLAGECSSPRKTMFVDDLIASGCTYRKVNNLINIDIIALVAQTVLLDIEELDNKESIIIYND